jgi:inosose dehydratase
MTPKIATAPISWGVSTVLGDMRATGLLATELGPPGYLPADPGELRELLRRHELELVGGFLAVPLHDESTSDASVRAAGEVAELLAAAGAEVLVLCAATGLTGYDERPELDDDQWRTLIETADRVAAVAAKHGLRTVLHPHVGSHVETEAEVERFVADSRMLLCLDTGHLLIGGADPVALARRHPRRIGHLHLKDVAPELARQVRDGEITFTAAVGKGLFVPLGDGGVDTESMLRSVRDAGYTGWYVLEQDIALSDDSPDDRPSRDTARSLAFLTDVLSGQS